MKRFFRRREPGALLVWSPPYTHRSSGVRALHRLCHHLNRCGYPCAMLSPPGAPLPDWDTPFHEGPIGDRIVIYPEIVPGNPLGAERVVRWCLNNPGLLGGDRMYADSEMVFVYDHQRLAIVNQAVRRPIGPERILWMGLVDPSCIYPDPRVPKTINCSFTHKGRALRDCHPLPPEAGLLALEDLTPSMAALGDTLRRTRTLYSYDHYSNVLREAAICGCRVLTMGEGVAWHDPQTCRCAHNIQWQPGFHATYARQFEDSSFVQGFVRELETRWAVPRITPWRRGRQ